jgi:hypothetical protein
MRRLLVAGADGTAQQLITGLTPGQYTLHAWTISTAGAEPFLAVSDFGGVPVQAFAAGEQWQKVSVEFTVPAGHSSAVIHFGAKASPGSSSYAAADDFYLYRK